MDRSITDKLPRVFVINLDRDTDRLAHIKAELGRAGVPFQRRPAVIGRALPPELASYFSNQPDRGLWLKDGEVGCYASHLLILREIASGIHGPYAIVMEDDIAIGDDFYETICALLSQLPRNWDIVRLSNTPKRAVIDVCKLPNGRRLIKYARVPTTTGAYLISREGARKFAVERRRYLPVDEDLRRPWNFGLRTFGVVPPPVMHAQAIVASSIDAIESGRLEGRSGFWPRLKQTQLSELVRRPLFNMRWLGPIQWTRCLAHHAISRLEPRSKKVGSSLVPEAKNVFSM